MVSFIVLVSCTENKEPEQKEEANSTIQTLRNMVSEQQDAFERLKSSPFNPYEKMGLNEEELKNSLVQTERNLNKAVRDNNLSDEEDMGEDYNDLVAQQTVASIGLSTSYPSQKNRLTNREENEKYINKIINYANIHNIIVKSFIVLFFLAK